MDFLINAEKREKKGTSSSRNIRRDGFVPGIIYGAGKEEQTISLRKHEVAKNLEQDAFYSQVLDISLDGKKEQVILRDIQRHPAKREILHMDFQRVKAALHLPVLSWMQPSSVLMGAPPPRDPSAVYVTPRSPKARPTSRPNLKSGKLSYSSAGAARYIAG